MPSELDKLEAEHRRLQETEREIGDRSDASDEDIRTAHFKSRRTEILEKEDVGKEGNGEASESSS